eukprot:811078_1
MIDLREKSSEEKKDCDELDKDEKILNNDDEMRVDRQAPRSVSVSAARAARVSLSRPSVASEEPLPDVVEEIEDNAPGAHVAVQHRNEHPVNRNPARNWKCDLSETCIW